ncbi:related to cytochrome b561 [Ceraceosorus bombacis]|uniref:Related to cytochrome b561 n=1 Tax=Ceraceosorus bombacis TaxID=401625 RepID=A0A0P1BA74_9BASI|nr:related to cytochrome b561 [Ceraceosorus bombacis]
MSASAASHAAAEQTQPLLAPGGEEEGLQYQRHYARGGEDLSGETEAQEEEERRKVLRETDRDSTPWRVFRSNNMSGSAWVVQIFAAAFVALVWSLVFSKMPWNNLPLFGYHPLLQSLGLVFISQSILVLQPTTTSRPKSKASALLLHQLIHLGIVLPLFTAGAIIMWYLHSKPGTQHFISWHGTFGFAAVIIAWAQAAVGAATVWGNGKLLGGPNIAKGLWKWHRLSGYILLPLFLLTFLLAILETTWVQGATSGKERAVIVLALVGTFLGGAARVQTSKLPKKTDFVPAGRR